MSKKLKSEEYGLIGKLYYLFKDNYGYSNGSTAKYLQNLAMTFYDPSASIINEIFKYDYIGNSSFCQDLQTRFINEAAFVSMPESPEKNTKINKASAFDKVLACYQDSINDKSLSVKEKLDNICNKILEVNQDIDEKKQTISGFISSLTINIVTDEDAHAFNDKLLDLIDTTPDYVSKNPRSYIAKNPNAAIRNLCESYPLGDKRILKEHIKRHNSIENLNQNIFLFLYYAIIKKMPPFMDFGALYTEQLTIFNNKVTNQYGNLSVPGIRQIITLANAEKPNVIALYEYADLLYYGSSNGPEKDLNKAFECYKALTKSAPPHPLAYWTLAYIYFNHGVTNTELEDKNCITELKDMSRKDKMELAAEYAIDAYIYGRNPAAANMLGKIYQLDEGDIPNIQSIRKEITSATNFKSAKDCFEYAAEHDYIYANGNLAKIYQRKLLTNNYDDNETPEEALEKYEYYLGVSASKFDPWALNLLGKLYYDGYVSESNKKSTIGKTKDKDKAKEFFLKAITQYKNKNSAYSLANLLLYYPEDYEKDLNQIIDYVNKIKLLENTNAISILKKEFEAVYCNRIKNKNDLEKIMSLLDDEKDKH